MNNQPQAAGTSPRESTFKPMLHAEHLEQLIDCYGLPHLLLTMSEIAHAKAEHVQTNWQDKQLAQAWTRIGKSLDKIGGRIPRL